MDTKMLMRIYSRSRGHGTDNPPYLHSLYKQTEKLNAHATVRARSARKADNLHRHERPPVRH